MKFEKVFLAAAMTIFAGLSGCGGGSGVPGGGAASDDFADETLFPSTSVPAEPADAQLFDVWTFKTGAVEHNCAQAGINVNESVSEQEIRVVREEAGCSLSGEDEAGNPLHAKNLTLFEVEDTLCSVGGNVLVFTEEEKFNLAEGKDCVVHVRIVGRFTRSGEILEGPLVGALSYEGSQCGEGLVGCSATTNVQAVKGRKVEGGFAYLSPQAPTPPQPAPAPAPQQPAPIPLPSGIFSDDAIRRLVEGLPVHQPEPAPEEEPQGNDDDAFVPTPPGGGGLPVPVPRR